MKKGRLRGPCIIGGTSRRSVRLALLEHALELLELHQHVVQAPLLVALGTAFASTTERGDEMMLAMLSRGCRAIRELETLELINSYR